MSAIGWVVLLCNILLAKGFMFDSMAHMKSLVDLEKELEDSLHNYLMRDGKDTLEVKEFAGRIENGTKVVKDQGSSYLDSPINAYAIIKRFTDGWSRLDSFLKHGKQYEDLTKKLKQSNASIPTNDERDFHGAIAALLRLQNTYNLTARSIIEGKIPGCQATTPLTPDDCFEFGSAAYRGNQYRASRDWLQEGLRLIRQPGYSGSMSLRSLLEYLAWVEYLTGHMNTAHILTKELVQLAPDVIKFRNNEKNYRFMVENGAALTKAQIEAAEEYNETETFMNSTYARLCQGKPVKINKNQNRLKCWYHGRRNPRLLLKPAKLELINLKPRIYMYRDFITDGEAERIKELATPKLHRATVFNSNTKQLEYADYRVAKSAWLEEGSDEVVTRVNRRASIVTGLDQECAEHLQVGNYGMGGQYEIHVDFGDPGTFIATHPKLGNRIATLLIYLNNVASGGATVFDIAGINVTPSKGDAVFWYNLKRSGQGDYTTLHAGCPVLCGNKWVANKWFRERGNIFNRPCALNKNL